MRITATAAVAVYGWWAVTRPPFSGRATVAVVGAGLVAMAWSHRRRTPAPPRTSATVWWPWGLVGAAAALWQAAAYAHGPRNAHPTLSSLANAALDSTAARTAAFVLWVLGAWELARR